MRPFTGTAGLSVASSLSLISGLACLAACGVVLTQCSTDQTGTVSVQSSAGLRQSLDSLGLPWESESPPDASQPIVVFHSANRTVAVDRRKLPNGTGRTTTDAAVAADSEVAADESEEESAEVAEESEATRSLRRLANFAGELRRHCEVSTVRTIRRETCLDFFADLDTPSADLASEIARTADRLTASSESDLLQLELTVWSTSPRREALLQASVESTRLTRLVQEQQSGLDDTQEWKAIGQVWHLRHSLRPTATLRVLRW